MTLIGIAGKAGSGKDTVAGYLCNAYGFVRYGLADPIKQMLEVLGVTPECWQPEHKEQPIGPFGKSPRRMAQTLGTEWGRHLIHPDIWLLMADRFIDSAQHSVVISDVRFENEAAWIRARGGQVWHLQRPSATAVEAHTSEVGVSFRAGDGVLINDGSLSSLFQRIEQLVRV
mgnify:CR=1 FL=1